MEVSFRTPARTTTGKESSKAHDDGVMTIKKQELFNFEKWN